MRHTPVMAIETLLKEALALPAAERKLLADALHESIPIEGEDGPVDPEWEAAWAAEIERRLRELDDGRVASISLAEFKRRMHARLSRP